MSTTLDRLSQRPPLIGALTVSTRTTQALSGVYTFGSAGNCAGYRFVAPTSSTLVDVYFYVSAVAGTGGTVTVELRSYSSSTLPGATLHATTSVATAAAAKWYKATFGSPFTLTANTSYYLVLTSNDATNFATIVHRSGPEMPDAFTGPLIAVTSANGFSTGSNTSKSGTVALAFGDGSVVGNPYTTNASDAANALERGIKIYGLDGPVAVSGLMTVAGVASNWNAVKIYSGTTAPGGSTVLSQSCGTANTDSGVARFAPTTLAAGTVYRIVFGFSGSSNNPGYYQIEDEATYGAAILDLVTFGGGQMCHTIDNGAGGWTDSTDRFERMALIVNSLPASAAPP
jgi:hypothetical protein